jgi:hypothetical protein
MERSFLLNCVLAFGSVVCMIPFMLFIFIDIVIIAGLFWFRSEETQTNIIDMMKDIRGLLYNARRHLLELEIEKLR